jgi:S1-C subfamily serine protease
MDHIAMLDAVERYLKGEMSQQERLQLEHLRQNNPDIDQLFVEQQMFLQQLDHYSDRREFRHELHHLHNKLLEAGEISETEKLPRGAKVIQFWNRYKRTISVAASIAGITALTISGMIHLLTPKPNQNYLQQLGRKVNELESRQREQSNKIAAIVSAPKSPEVPQRSSGSSFLIDGKGYLITNAHVVKDASTLVVVNKGMEYIAKLVYSDVETDLAILKIEDKDWKNRSYIPYTIRKTTVDLGEEIFTLGYPRNEIVYNRGYMSARSGYNDDTLSIQVAIGANPGNSGGPVLDRNGDIIGILSTRDRQANEVVFATKAINISKVLEELKENDSSAKKISLPSYSNLRNMDRVQQIKKLQECVFMVKAY